VCVDDGTAIHAPASVRVEHTASPAAPVDQHIVSVHQTSTMMSAGRLVEEQMMTSTERPQQQQQLQQQQQQLAGSGHMQGRV